MNTHRRGAGLIGLVLGAVAALASPAKSDVIDNFEDGNISTANWVIHGYKGGYGGIGAGNWQYSFSEQTASDGYLEARVQGPQSGWTYGAEASIRTQQNFNDGKDWLVNFTWDTSVNYVPHVDEFAIQMTDGMNLDNTNWFWTMNQMPEGTTNLYQSGTDRSPAYPTADTPKPPFSKTSWSVLIQDGKAGLYQAPDAQGTSLRTVSLDANGEWYLRFLLNDATSSGFDRGDNSIRLYNYSSTEVPGASTLGALISGLPLLLRRKR